MWKTTPITIFFLLALMPWLDPPGALSFGWDVSNTSAILISALLGFLLQWSGALALGWDSKFSVVPLCIEEATNSVVEFWCSATSATSHVVLGQFKTCVILLGGYILFNSDPGFVSICGAVAALCGMSVYTSLNLREARESAGKQSLPSFKEKANNEDQSCEKPELTNTPNVVWVVAPSIFQVLPQPLCNTQFQFFFAFHFLG